MKKVLSLVVALVISGYAMSQDEPNKNIQTEKPTGDIYCVALQDDGKIAVILNGKDMIGSVTLTNGTVIKENGMVVSNNGKQLILKEGQCVDSLGNVLMDDKTKSMKKEEKMSPGDK